HRARGPWRYPRGRRVWWRRTIECHSWLCDGEECVIENGAKPFRLGEKGIMSVVAAQVDQLARSGERARQLLQLLTRDEEIALLRHERGRGDDALRLDAMQVARERQREKVRRRESIGEPLAVVSQVGLD